LDLTKVFIILTNLGISWNRIRKEKWSG